MRERKSQEGPRPHSRQHKPHAPLRSPVGLATPSGGRTRDGLQQRQPVDSQADPEGRHAPSSWWACCGDISV